MNFNPTKKLLTALLASALLLSAAACTTPPPKKPLPTSADSTIETTQEELPTTEQEAKDPQPEIPLNEHYTEIRTVYDDGTTGFVFCHKQTNASTLEVRIPTEPLLSVNIVSEDRYSLLIDFELKSDSAENRHQFAKVTYNTEYQTKNFISKTYENLIHISADRILYLDGSYEERSIGMAFPVYTTLCEQGSEHYQGYAARFFPLPDAAQEEFPILEIQVTLNYYNRLNAFTVFYKDKNRQMAAKTCLPYLGDQDSTLHKDNPYKSVLGNILQLNQYTNAVSHYEGFALTDSDWTYGMNYAELILRADHKVALIDNNGYIYSLTDLFMERVYTDGTYSWTKETETGKEYGLAQISINDGGWGESPEGGGWTHHFNLYRAVEDQSGIHYFIQEIFASEEREVTKEQFEAFAKQFGQTEIDWLPLTEECINQQFPGECAKVFAPNFTDYDSIIDLCADLMTFLGAYHYVGTPEEDYEVNFYFPTEEEYEWFKRLYRSTYAPACISPLDYTCLSGYCIKDLNGDGVDELILLSEEWPHDAAVSILGVFTMKDGRPVMLEDTVDWIDENGFLHDGYFYHEEGYHDIYKVISGGFEPVESFGSLLDENKNLTYYRVIDGKKTSITKAEFDALMQAYPAPENDEKKAIVTYTKGGISYSHSLPLGQYGYRDANWRDLLDSNGNPTITYGSLYLDPQGDDQDIEMIKTADSNLFLGIDIFDQNRIGHSILLELISQGENQMTFDNGTLAGKLVMGEHGKGTLTITHSTTPLIKIGEYEFHFANENGFFEGK